METTEAACSFLFQFTGDAMSDCRQSGTDIAALAAVGICAFVLASAPVIANPEGGQVVGGSATVSGQGTQTVTVKQESQKAILNWESFSIKPGEVTQFLQPGAQAIALNRVIGADPSLIYGTLSANGKLILINPNGMTVGPSGLVNANSFIASTANISDENFLAGKFTFDIAGREDARIVNEGAVTAAQSGLVAFVAPGVKNSGLISAKLGSVTLGAATKFTLDFYGDQLVSFPVDAMVTRVAAGTRTLIEAGGTIQGANIVLSAQAARGVIDNVIVADGNLVARTASIVDGKIRLGGGNDPRAEQRNGSESEFAIAEDLSQAASSSGSGTIAINGGSHGRVELTGSLDASDASGGSIVTTGETIYADGLLLAEGFHKKGGSISLDGRWISIGGFVSASGAASGGSVDVVAGGLSLAGTIAATGGTGSGGSINVSIERSSVEFKGARIDASGANGGSIRNVAGQQVTTSATYTAIGRQGTGGQIDLSAPATKLLSPTFNASGFTAGGLIRIGGEFQGGKSLTVDELPNAITTVASDGTKLHVDVLGPSGAGGTGIVWSDVETVFLGSIFARPGTELGEGGFAEISSAGFLQYGGHIATGIGSRQGTILFDPKNINIVDLASSTQIQLQLILGYNYEGVPSELSGPATYTTIVGGESSIALDGRRLAVASTAFVDQGMLSNVMLFTFTDDSFSGAVVEAVVGPGFTGGKNIDLAPIVGVRPFSEEYLVDYLSVALDGRMLAIGHPSDEGPGVDNDSDGVFSLGSVFLFSFEDLDFSGGRHVGSIGNGYFGPNDYGFEAGELTSEQRFGWNLSLNDHRLAVASPNQIHLFTFTDDNFSDLTLARTIDTSLFAGPGPSVHGVSLDGNGLAVIYNSSIFLLNFDTPHFLNPRLVGTLGRGASGVNDVNTSSYQSPEDRWTAVSLDEGRLAAALSADAVYLFRFDDTNLTGAERVARIGSGLGGGRNIDLQADPQAGDFRGLGSALSLDGTRLAVGAVGDSGKEHVGRGTGAVYLFTFDDLEFNGGDLRGVIGFGYQGTSDFDLSSPFHYRMDFGSAVSLDGMRLAVGAEADQGACHCKFREPGAVYLFSFDDNDFGGAALESIIGVGYTGGKNIDMLENPSARSFGRSISLDGNRLAVGSFGGVHLFTFADPVFSGGRPALSIDQASDIIQPGAGFGRAVSLDGTNLVVGQNGATHWIAFDDLALNGGELVTTVGIDGSSVSLDGQRLAVYSNPDRRVYLLQLDEELGSLEFRATLPWSAPFPRPTKSHRGTGPAVTLEGKWLAVGDWDYDPTGSAQGFGAVHLFKFEDLNFSGGDYVGSIGPGFNGANDYDIGARLSPFERFGISLSLNEGRLAVGAANDQGATGGGGRFGAVYLFALGDGEDGIPPTGFNDSPGDDVTISARAIASLLASGQDVILQANNDITLSTDLIVDNLLFANTFLKLHAGRSVTLNGSINTRGASLEVVANYGGTLTPNPVSAVDAYRDPGPASITMAGGKVIDAGGGLVRLEIDTGSRYADYEKPGNISVRDITAGNILLEVSEFSDSSGYIILNGFLQASGDGTAIVVRTRQKFLNFSGPLALLTPNGRWLVYSGKPIENRFDGLAADQVWGVSFEQVKFRSDVHVPNTGNRFVFQQAYELDQELGEVGNKPPASAGGNWADHLEHLKVLIAEQFEEIYGANLENSESVFVARLNGQILSARPEDWTEKAWRDKDWTASDPELAPAVVAEAIGMYGRLAATVYNFGSPLPEGYVLKHKNEKLKSGLAYAVYKSENGKVVVSFRGTEGCNICADWRTNIGHLADMLTVQSVQALDIAQKVIAQYGAENVVVVGHSLGGYLAQFVGSYTGVDAIAVDSAPFASTEGEHTESILSTGLRKDKVHNCTASVAGRVLSQCADGGYRQLGTEYYFSLLLADPKTGTVRSDWTEAELQKLKVGKVKPYTAGYHSSTLFADVLDTWEAY
jgi:filamentous hemagglutinin family protein